MHKARAEFSLIDVTATVCITMPSRSEILLPLHIPLVPHGILVNSFKISHLPFHCRPMLQSEVSLIDIPFLLTDVCPSTHPISYITLATTLKYIKCFIQSLSSEV